MRFLIVWLCGVIREEISFYNAGFVCSPGVEVIYPLLGYLLPGDDSFIMVSIHARKCSVGVG